MAQIIQFPPTAAKLGYRRVKKRGRALENPGQLDLFSPATAQILTFQPALPPFEFALQLDERGDGRAAEFYLRAIEAGDCVADCYCNLGILESHQGNTAKAFDCFTSALKHNPRHSEAHFNLGNLYFDINDFRLAQIHYEMAVAIDPAFANIYFNLAFVQMINGEAAAAGRSLRHYQELASPEEGKVAQELLRELQTSLAAARQGHSASR